MKLKTFLILNLICLASFAVNAQESTKPSSVKTANSMKIIPSLSSRTNLKLAPKGIGIAKDKKLGKNVSVYGKGLPNGDDPLVKKNETDQKKIGRAPSLVFDGVASDSQPTDPDGAVGPNHYIVVFNTGFRIFDKLGNPLTGQLDTSNIFPASGCCDLTCSYDTQADRFVLTFLGNGVQVAVSQTADPVNGGWYVYNYPMDTDYQKLSIWSDGYYFTANKDSGSADSSEVVYAIERSKMLLGDTTAKIVGFPLPGIKTSGFYCPQAFNVTSSNFPAAGNVPIVYMQDDSWAGVSEDHIKLWTVNMNWATPTLSTISAPQTIITTPFNSVFDNGSFINLPQPNGGTLVDALQATVMNQAQFRKFPSHNSAVFNFVVDADGTSEKLAAVRWYELRQSADGLPWSIYQEGTYAAPAGKHAWNASMGIDNIGNIGMGYTGMGGTSNQILSSYYTGRYANDPLGEMSITENLIAPGNGNIPGTRYGDYSKLAIDPSDDKSFWFINELYNTVRKDVVGVFKIAPNFNNDVGIANIINPISSTLTNSESVTISIFNYGLATASNFPVSYQINGGAIVTETFTGSITSANTATFTFAALANLSTLGQSYSILAKTNLTGDQFLANDSKTKVVANLNPKDIGVSAIISPVSGIDLTATENIRVTLNNFGGQPQTNFNVFYNLNGTIFSNLYTGILAPNSSVNYTFTQTGNFSAVGGYALTSYTNLLSDSNNANDSTTVSIIKNNCQSVQDCSLNDGIRSFQLGTINNTSGCGANGYNDFTNLSTSLSQGSSNNLTISTAYGSQHVSVWIDLNNDFVFSNNERVVNNFIVAPNQNAGTFTESTSLSLAANAALGEHLLRVRANYNAAVPDDSCQDTNFGEVEDYKVNITGSLSNDGFTFSKSDLKIAYLEENQFQLVLETQEISDPLLITVHDIVGKRLVYHKIQNKNGSYTYDLDMSYAPSGIYLIRIGNDKFGKIKKIIVK